MYIIFDSFSLSNIIERCLQVGEYNDQSIFVCGVFGGGGNGQMTKVDFFICNLKSEI